MNGKQRMAIIIGIVMVVLTSWCAPWAILNPETGALTSHCYGSVFATPGEIINMNNQDSQRSIKLDTEQLFAEWAFIVLLVCGFVLLNVEEREHNP